MIPKWKDSVRCVAECKEYKNGMAIITFHHAAARNKREMTL
jgi:hypothetical protein